MLAALQSSQSSTELTPLHKVMQYILILSIGGAQAQYHSGTVFLSTSACVLNNAFTLWRCVAFYRVVFGVCNSVTHGVLVRVGG
jgi:hypothetical protein